MTRQVPKVTQLGCPNILKCKFFQESPTTCAIGYLARPASLPAGDSPSHGHGARNPTPGTQWRLLGLQLNS